VRTHVFPNGDEIPLFGLGTWKSTPGEVGAAVREALRLGYRHFDCAPIYANEPEVGEALARGLEECGLAREDVWVTSKLWNNAHEPENVRPALERTLRDLRLDYLDLYLMHWPIAQRRDIGLPDRGDQLVSLDEIPLDATWAAMEETVDRGLCRHIGVSNFSARKITGILEGCRIRPEVDQVERHPYLRQQALVDSCRANGILVTGYSPLGSRDRPERLLVEGEPVLLEDPVVIDVARAAGATPAQVLIAWAIGHDTAVIPKTVRPERLAENLAGSRLELDPEALARLDGLDRHHRYISGAFWAKPGSPYTVAGLWDE
jgi:alcohol dehydrogenase (NADP+)